MGTFFETRMRKAQARLQKTETAKSVGFSFGAAQIVLLVLKLVGAIDWSWWLIMSPTLYGFASWIMFCIYIVILMVIYARNVGDE